MYKVFSENRRDIINNEIIQDKKRVSTFKLIGVILSLFGLIVIYYETKMLDLLLGIFKVECLKKKIATVSLKTYMFITKEEDSNILVEKMESMGWNFEDVYGRGYLFSKNREEVLLVRKHHLNYYIYEVQGKEFFLKKNK